MVAIRVRPAGANAKAKNPAYQRLPRVPSETLLGRARATDTPVKSANPPVHALLFS